MIHDSPFRATMARPSDFKRVARLCRRAVGPTDYVLSILDQVIHEKGLYLAWAGEELVGITNIDRCIDGSAWLSMARTDPSWRRKGVALFLQRELAIRARKRGVRIFRLWVLSDNLASLKLCIKSGFQPVCEAAHVTHAFRRKRTHRVARSIRPSRERLRSSLIDSPYVAMLNGYIAYNWHFVRANRNVFRRIWRTGEISLDDDLAYILTRPQVRFHRLTTSFALLHGSAQDTMEKVKLHAKGLGVASVGGYLPYDQRLLRSASKAGFRIDEWGTHSIVLEKKLS